MTLEYFTSGIAHVLHLRYYFENLYLIFSVCQGDISEI